MLRAATAIEYRSGLARSLSLPLGIDGMGLAHDCVLRTMRVVQ